jgi:hypothetical protein
MMRITLGFSARAEEKKSKSKPAIFENIYFIVSDYGFHGSPDSPLG